MKRIVTQSVIGAVLATLSAVAMAQDMVPPPSEFSAPKEQYSPYSDDHYPRRVFFGDTHLHTKASTDVGMAGAQLGADAAYRVARGETVKSGLGWDIKLVRPLDFLVVSDHAENLGLADFISQSDPLILANKTGKRWHDMVKTGKGIDAFLEWLNAGDKDMINEPLLMESAWLNQVKTADKYYQPGVFTTLHGFEWTSHPEGNNMHRVVIFRDGMARTSQVLPYSQYDSTDPEDLWKYMAGYEKKTGGRVLAIPHNGNLSNGTMFDIETYTGKQMSMEYARTRLHYEPLAEVTQMKGDGEAHPLLSPDDEFADYETMDKGNLSGKYPKTDDMLYKEYARSALKTGLQLEEKLGVNPFKFGMIGASDSHSSLPTTREENFFNKAPYAEPSPDRWKKTLIESKVDHPALSILVKDIAASGLAAVWARENTREAIWDAMNRKEVYATTGGRMQVRVFAGWDFEPEEIQRPDFAREGYKRGVPMGGDLFRAPEGKAPVLMIRALRDFDGANLDRIQVIKGWLDDKGELHEKIYDVAVSDGRKIGADGRCKTPVGSTVDIANASYTNDIGAPLLLSHWQDPDFDPDARAFYYVRVIEIPTPRWTAYDAKFFNVEMSDDVEMTVQDRAYTSPIWYTP